MERPPARISSHLLTCLVLSWSDHSAAAASSPSLVRPWSSESARLTASATVASMSIDLRRNGLAAAGASAARASSMTRVPSAGSGSRFGSMGPPPSATQQSIYANSSAAASRQYTVGGPVGRIPALSPSLVRGRSGEVARDSQTKSARASSLVGAPRPTSSSHNLANGSVKRAASPAAGLRAPTSVTPVRRPSIDGSMYGMRTASTGATVAAGSTTSSALRPTVPSASAARSGMAAASLASRQGPVRAYGTSTSTQLQQPAQSSAQSSGISPGIQRRVTVTRVPESSDSSQQYHATPSSTLSAACRSAPSTDPSGSRRTSLSSSTSTENLLEAARAAAEARTADRQSQGAAHSRQSSGSYAGNGTHPGYPYATSQSSSQQNGYRDPPSSALQTAYSAAMAQAQAQAHNHSSYTMHSTTGSQSQQQTHSSYTIHSTSSQSQASAQNHASYSTHSSTASSPIPPRRASLNRLPISPMSPDAVNSSAPRTTASSSVNSTPSGREYAPYSSGFNSTYGASGNGASSANGGLNVAASAAQRVASISGHFANTHLHSGMALAANGANATSNEADSGRRPLTSGSSTPASPDSSRSAAHRSLHSTTTTSSSASAAAGGGGGLISTPAMRNAAAMGYGPPDEDDESMEFESAYARKPTEALNRAGSLGRSAAAGAPSSNSNGTAASGASGTSKRMRGLVGLANLGNTCFLNSTLQCLFSTPGFFEYFATGQWEAEVNTKAAKTRGALAKAFGALAARMASASDGSVERPSAVKQAVSIIDSKFAGYGQHDSHEFCRVLLAALHDDVNRIRVKPAYEEIKDGDHDSDAVKADRWWRNYTERNDSIVTDSFAGQIQSTLVCQSCKHQSEAFDPFMDLSLPIPKASSGLSAALSRLSPFSSSSASSAGGSNSRSPSLMDCFSEFLREELLSGNEQVYCRRCKTHRSQTKKFRIYRWPRILVLHLKRFSYGSHTRAKLDTDVEFPVELDCRKMQLQGTGKEAPARYTLCGVSNHMGSASGGHYTASCKVVDAPNAPFYTFNDSSVFSGCIQSRPAYVLFYRQMDN